MNKVNFNKLKNISVPDEWIESALAIPGNSRQKPIPFFTRYKRVVTTVVAALIICVMSFPLYLFNKTQVVLPVKPATEQTDVSNNGELPSDSSMNISYETNGTFPVTKTDVSQKEVEPVSSRILTQDNTDGNVPPTQQTSPLTIVPKPTPPAPTRPEPTNPHPTNPDPTTISLSELTEPSSGNYVTMIPSCVGVYDASNMMVGVDSIEETYCCLYDSRGVLVGDPDLYSPEHIANATYMQNGYVFLSYEPMEKGLKLEVGTYKYFFYLSDWDVVYEGEIKVY